MFSDYAPIIVHAWLEELPRQVRPWPDLTYKLMSALSTNTVRTIKTIL